ncbi:MAG: phytoene desaturase family protein [Acidimicrobiia bacterium]
MTGGADAYDAVVVGAGPNGLVGAITLARTGRRVLLLEAAPCVGGGTRSEPLTEPGFVHDVCSTVHALAIASPAFAELPLADHGVEWVHPEIPVAHPLDGGRAAVLRRDVTATAAAFTGADARAYRRLFDPLVEHHDAIVETLMQPLRAPRAPLVMAGFGLHAIRSARALAHGRFEDGAAQALLGGCAAHAMQPLTHSGTAGYALFLMLLAHHGGWPVARGGSQRLADALTAILTEAGGEVVTDHEVTDLAALPPAPITLLDLTPRQVLRIAGERLPPHYRAALGRYRYGPGVCKVDWALAEPIPWTNAEVRGAGTVHLGGSLDEVVAAEAAVAAGRHPDRPYVIVVQPTVMDPTRAPAGRHVGWAYCHVPNGSGADQTSVIEDQVERFAPGFRDTVIGRHTMTAPAMEAHDANYVGGDINGGAGDLRQLFTRPVTSPRPWATPVDGLYLCSSATPPGGGVHGMGGLLAAQLAMRRES